MNVYLIFVTHHSISDEYTESLETNTVRKYIVYCTGHFFWGVRTRGVEVQMFKPVTWDCFVTRQSRQIVVLSERTSE
jgi:hypothetical protein